MEMDKKVIREYTIKRQGTGSNIVDEGQKAYTDLKKPETYFSLRIGHNIKCVESTKRKAPKYTFDIVVDNSIKSRGPGDYKVAAEEIKRKRSLFGGSKKQESNVVFSLRADTQEIYNAWVDKINTIAENSSCNDAVVSLTASPSVLSSNGSIASTGSVRSTPASSPVGSTAQLAPAPAAATTAAAAAPAPAAAAAPAPVQTDISNISLYEPVSETPVKAPELPVKDVKPAVTETATETATEKASEAIKEQEKPVAA